MSSNEFRSVVFEVGETDLEKIGFNLGLQELLRRELPKSFPSKGGGAITLKLVRSGGGNLHWTFQGDQSGAKYYLKVSFGKGRLDGRKVEGHRRAQLRSVLVNDVLTTTTKGNLAPYFRDLKCKSGWMILEAVRFIEERLTLNEWLKRASFIITTTQGSFRGVGENIARRMHEMHTFSPKVSLIGEKAYQQFHSPKKRQRMYRGALLDIMARIDTYMPLGQEHPLVGREGRDRLLEGINKFFSSWKGRGDRLSLVHGDSHSDNTMLLAAEPGLDVAFIDCSPRVQLGEPRWDDGRLVGDLLQRYFEASEAQKETIQILINSFIETAERSSGDSLYRQGLVWGIFSMTLLKFNLKGRPIIIQEVARAYLNNSLRIIEQGYFSWPS